MVTGSGEVEIQNIFKATWVPQSCESLSPQHANLFDPFPHSLFLHRRERPNVGFAVTVSHTVATCPHYFVHLVVVLYSSFAPGFEPFAQV